MNLVNIHKPCNGDAYQYEGVGYDYHQSCVDCRYFETHFEGKCLGYMGWAFMAIAAAEVARERDTGGTITNVTIYPAGPDPRLVQDDWGWEE